MLDIAIIISRRVDRRLVASFGLSRRLEITGCLVSSRKSMPIRGCRGKCTSGQSWLLPKSHFADMQGHGATRKLINRNQRALQAIGLGVL